MQTWPIKISIKLLLSWIPNKHKALRKLGIFRHGKMDDINYALTVFNLHARRAFPEGFPYNFTALELGPGDSLISALIAAANGASQIYLVDDGDYAQRDITIYQKAAQELKNKHSLNTPDISKAKSIQEILKICNASYLTNGLKSLEAIPDRSIDFLWSQSVLEHVRKRDFRSTMRQIARILKADGIASHHVDLKDHFDKSLNNLRFSDNFWENDYIARAGFYTNRLRYSQSLEEMNAAGLNTQTLETGSWPNLPLNKNKLAAPFNKMNDDELKIRSYGVIQKSK